MTKALKQKIRDYVYGFALGDAFGVPHEFKSAETLKDVQFKFIGYGTHHQPPGTWSDDTGLLLALMDSNGSQLSIQNNFTAFLKEGKYTCDGKVFDVGNSTKTNINLFQPGVKHTAVSTKLDNGNGALMWSFPLAVFLLEEPNMERRFNYIKEITSITHSHLVSVECCFVYTELIRNFLNGHFVLDIAEISKFTPNIRSTIFYVWGDFNGSNGYALDTLLVVLKFFIFRRIADETINSVILKTCQLGGDTDTNCALTAGLFCLVKHFPEKYRKHIRNIELIDSILDRFLNDKTGL